MKMSCAADCTTATPIASTNPSTAGFRPTAEEGAQGGGAMMARSQRLERTLDVDQLCHLTAKRLDQCVLQNTGRHVVEYGLYHGQ